MRSRPGSRPRRHQGRPLSSRSSRPRPAAIFRAGAPWRFIVSLQTLAWRGRAGQWWRKRVTERRLRNGCRVPPRLFGWRHLTPGPPASAPDLGDELSPPERLAVAYAPVGVRPAWLGLLALDRRLARLALAAR